MQQLNKSGAPLFLKVVTPVIRSRRVTKIQPANESVFILSTGRTGTVYLADILNQVNGVLAVHEPKPSRVLNAWTTAFLEGLVSNDYMATALASKRRKTLKNVRVTRYVESNNFIAGFADALPIVFNNPTIIHLVRDPRDFATSLTNRGDDTGIRKFFNRYVPYWAYVPKGVKKRELDALTRAAHRWVAINKYLNTFGQSYDKYHYFTFEEVFNRKDPGAITPLLSAIGLSEAEIAGIDFAAKPRKEESRLRLLDKPVDSTNRSKHQHMQPWRNWSKQECQQLDAICGDLMREYGYGNEPEWLEKLS